MFLKIFLLLWASIAVAAVKPHGEGTSKNCKILTYKEQVFQLVVLLEDNENIIILSVAFFRPELSHERSRDSIAIPILPMNRKTSLEIPVFTVGFAKNREMRTIPSVLVNCEENICEATSALMVSNSGQNRIKNKHTNTARDNDPNRSDIPSDEYFPQIGDVLVTEDSLVGIMLRFKRNKAFVSGEYYFSSYPNEDVFDGVEETEALANSNYYITNEKLRFINFGKNVLQYTVILRDTKNGLNCAGYIVTNNTIITPTEKFQKFEGSIKFYVKTKFGYGARTIYDKRSYNDFLTVARFYPTIPHDIMEGLPRLPVLPINEKTPLDIPVLTLGFSANRERRIVFSDLINRNENMWNAGSTLMIPNSDENSNVSNEEHASSTIPVVEDDPNCFEHVRQTLDIPSKNYSPLLGDVLITKSSILGIMVKFERQGAFVVGQYYSFDYPTEKEIEKLKENFPPRT